MAPCAVLHGAQAAAATTMAAYERRVRFEGASDKYPRQGEAG
jgi:hypothetical protein